MTRWLTDLLERATPGRCLPLFLVAAWGNAYLRLRARSPLAPAPDDDLAARVCLGLALATLVALIPRVGALAERLARGPGGWLVALALVPLLFVQTHEVVLAAPVLLIWWAWARGEPGGSPPARAFPWVAAAFALEALRGLGAEGLAQSPAYRAACCALLLAAAACFLWRRIGEAAAAALRGRPLLVVLPVLLMLAAGRIGIGRGVGWFVAWGLWASGLQVGSDLRWAWRAVLAAGLALRLLLIAGAPWPCWSADTPSYLSFVHDVLLDRHAVVDPSRTPVFPLFVLATVGPTRSYLSFLLCSHLVGLAVAWWAGRALRPVAGEPAGLLCFAWLALFPKLIDYEHVLGPEALFVALLTIASVLAVRLLTLPPPGAPAAIGLGLPLALGLATSLTVLARPAGLVILPALGLAAVWRRLPLSRLAALAVAVAVPLLGWASYNRATHGFFGLTLIGDQALFGVAGHLVDPDSPGFEELKEEMRPGLARHNATRPFWDPDFNWLLYSREGPLAGPRAQALPSAEYYATVRAMALQAIRGRPLHFSLRCAYQVWIYTLQPELYSIPPWPYPLWPKRDSRALAEPPAARELIDSPAVRWLGGLRAGPVVYDVAVRASALTSALPFHVAEQPIVALLLLVAAIGRRRERAALLFLSGAALALILVVCVLNEPTHRYHLQTVPLLAVGLCVVIGRVTQRRVAETRQETPL